MLASTSIFRGLNHLTRVSAPQPLNAPSKPSPQLPRARTISNPRSSYRYSSLAPAKSILSSQLASRNLPIPRGVVLLTSRPYTTTTTLSPKKKKKILKKRKVAIKSPLKLPTGIAEHVGQLTKEDILSMLARNKPDSFSSSTGSARTIGSAEAARSASEGTEELEEEVEEVEDGDDDIFFTEEELAQERGGFVRDEDEYALENQSDEDPTILLRKRRRSAPPYAPGRVSLDPDNWTTEMQDCLVEYMERSDEDVLTRHLGIVRRPRGMRHWGVMNLDDESERRVNIYKITFQWPPQTDGNFGIELEEARLLQSASQSMYNSIPKTPVSLWRSLVANLKPSKRARVVIPSNGSARATAVHIMPEGHLNRPIRRRDHIPTDEYLEEKPDEESYIELTEAASKLFDISIDHVTPVHLYTTHRFLDENPIYFYKNVHRGYLCREPTIVQEKLQQMLMAAEDARIRREFVEKLKPLLEYHRSLNALKDASTPVLTHNLPDLSEFKKPTFTARDMDFLDQLKRFALASDNSEDVDLSSNILKPLGFGDKPHHAFDLLSQLDLISKFDNPHFLRWTGTTSWTPQQTKLANEIIELTDGEKTLLLDPDANSRVDFSGTPTFAIDQANAEEIDDAVSLVLDDEHREWIYVHITDVHRYILPDSILDLTARERAASIYLPEATYGIFPDALREHLSLGGKNMAPNYEQELENLDAQLPTSRASKPEPSLVENSSASRIISAMTPSQPQPSEHITESRRRLNSISGIGATTKARGKQPVLSFGALLDGAGKVEEWRVVNGYVSNVQRVTYDQINEIMAPKEDLSMEGKLKAGEKEAQERLESGKTSAKNLAAKLQVALEPISAGAAHIKKHHYHTFLRLMDFATKRRSYRLDNRAVVTSRPEPHISVDVDPSGKAQAHIGVYDDFNKNSRGMVHEFMLMAGQIAALFSRANSVPMLYMVQDIRRQEHDRSLLDISHQANLLSVNPKAKAPEIMKNLANWKALRPTVLTPVASPNEALGLPMYTSITSPLRKYIDLIGHYQIKAALRRKLPPFGLRELHDLGTPLLARRAEVNALMRNANRFWILGCLAEMTRGDRYRKFKALVVESKSVQNAEEATVMLMDFALENNITVNRHIPKGSIIHVRVDIVNPFYDVLILKEVKINPKRDRTLI